MKSYIRGAAIVVAVLVGAATAHASTYDVNFSFIDQSNDTITVTGNIVTTCDSCSLTGANISSFSFSWNGPFSASNSGLGANVGGFGSVLSASGGVIQFISALGSYEIFSGQFAVLPNVSFGESHPELCGASPLDVNCVTLIDSSFNNTFGHVSLPFTIATEEVSTVPLPAALPLFATGLGALGLLGWRRKRKALAA